VPASAPYAQAMTRVRSGLLQPVQHLPDGGAADAVHLGQFPLGGQAAVTFDVAGGDQRAEPLVRQDAGALATLRNGAGVRLIQMGAYIPAIDGWARGAAGLAAPTGWRPEHQL